MKTFEKTRYAAAHSLGCISAFFAFFGAKQAPANVYIAKSIDGMLATKDCCEKHDVFTTKWVETSIRTPVVASGLRGLVHDSMRRPWVFNFSEGVEVADVGLAAYLRIPPEVGDPLCHWIPAHFLFAVALPLAIDLELAWMIDHCLDPQYDTVFVVHFNPVLFHPMLDASSRPTLLVVIEHFTRKEPVELSSEESKNVLGTQADRGVPEQSWIQTLQGSAAGEYDISGELSLVGHPVVAHVFEKVGHQRVDLSRNLLEDEMPGKTGELVGNPLRVVGILKPVESVVHLSEAGPGQFQLASKPVVPVDVDLDGEWEPRLNAHVDEAKVGVEVVEVQAKAFAPGRTQSRPVLAKCDLEAVAGLNGCKNADEALADTVSLGDFASQLFLASPLLEVDVGSGQLVGHGPGVKLESLGLIRDKLLEILDEYALLSQEALHGLGVADREVAFEDETVEAGKGGVKLVDVLGYEVRHGVLPPR